jgi:ribonuclease HI
MPTQKQVQAFRDADYTLQFDGAYQKAVGGAGGVILVDSKGQLLRGEAYFFGRQAQPNNVAEAQALVEALQLAVDFVPRETRGQVVVAVKGDSDLVIKFLTKVYRPQKKELVMLVRKAQEI